MLKLKYLSVYFLSLTLLLGCSNLSNNDSVTTVDWNNHQARLIKLTHYRLNGKLGYISPQQKQSLNFHLQHTPELTQLRLSTFLGQSVLNLTSTADNTTATTYDGQVLTNSDASRLIEQITGLQIPIDAMQEWLKGLPYQADRIQLNSNNTLAWLNKRINQRLWTVEYQQYTDVMAQPTTASVMAIPLPSKLILKQNETTLKIVVNQWIVN